MRTIRKTAVSLCTALLTALLMGTTVSAADGTLMFSDPEAQVGDAVEVDLVLQTGGAAIGDVSVTLSYDTEYLEFLEGENTESEEDGILTCTMSGDGTESEISETLQFTALRTGDTVIEIEESSAELYSGETLVLTEGSSTISISAADDGTESIESSQEEETTDIVVTVNGEEYYFSESFSASLIPMDFSETTLTFHGEEREFVVNDAGIYLGYLVDSSGEGDFFLFREDDATFVPYTAIEISDTTTIVLLSDTEELSIPSSYLEGEMTVSDLTYPYWVDPDEEGYDILYALNLRTGSEGFYSYDREDGTYQSYEMPESDTASDIETFGSRLGEFMEQYAWIMLIAIIVLAALMVLFLVKLVFRNRELDYLYDEFEFHLDEGENQGSDEQAESYTVAEKKETAPDSGEAAEGQGDPGSGKTADEMGKSGETETAEKTGKTAAAGAGAGNAEDPAGEKASGEGGEASAGEGPEK